MKLVEQEVNLDHMVNGMTAQVAEEITEQKISEAYEVLASFETYNEEVKASRKMRDALAFAQIRKSAMQLNEKKYHKAIRVIEDHMDKLANEIASIQVSHDMMAHAIASGRISF